MIVNKEQYVFIIFIKIMCENELNTCISILLNLEVFGSKAKFNTNITRRNVRNTEFDFIILQKKVTKYSLNQLKSKSHGKN